MLTPRQTALAVLLTFLAAAPALASNGAIPPSVGPKGPVSIPVDGDAQTMFRMPSSIGWSLDHRVDLDGFYFYSETSMRNSLNDYNSQGGTFGGSGGVVLAFGRPDFDADESAWDDYSFAKKFTLGFGIFVDMAGGGGTPAKVRYQTYPETIGVTTGITFVNFAPTAAFTITDWLSIGASFHIIYSSFSFRTLVGGSSTPLGGSPQINGVPLPGNPSYSDFLDIFSNDAQKDPTTFFKGELLGFQFGGALSISLKPLDNLGFGISYRFKSVGPAASGSGTVDASRTFDEALKGLDPAIQSLFLQTLPNGGNQGFMSDYDVELEGISVPAQARFSVAWWPTDRLLIGAEVAWIEWHPSFDKATVQLKDGSNGDVNFVTGTTSLDTTIALRWRNQWVFSLITAFGVTDDWTLRLGMNYGRVPIDVDRQGGGPSSVFSSTHLDFGVGWRILDNLEVNVMVEHSFYYGDKEGFTDDIPTARGSHYGAKQWFIHIGVGFSF